MKIPILQGLIKRRILVNYRVEPLIIQTILPKDFRPKLHKNKAIAGICLIRLEQIRPQNVPDFIGISSENAAHRVAVEWEENSETKEGVFIPRRDTDSLLNRIAGGRIFPSEHHKADFKVEKNKGRINFSMKSADKKTFVKLSGEVAENFPQTSIFDSLQEASAFFEKGSLGYSTNKTDTNLDGVILQIENWQAKPLNIDFVESSFYSDKTIFPKNSIEFDHALLMENIEHQWHSAKSFELNR